MNRAYSTFDIKSIDEDARVITGVASSISTDRMGDIVRPKGAKFSLPLPLLYQHDHKKPVGHVQFAEVGDKDIRFRAAFSKIDEPGPVKDRVDEAWQDVKHGLVRGVSIGFRALEHEFMKDGDGIDFKSWEWIELSVVTIPANQDASIQTIRSIDAAHLAVVGNEKRTSSSPGGPGATRPKPKERAMTITEQITAFEAKRAAKAARMDELMTKASEDGSTLDQAQSEEYDTLKDEVDSVDVHLRRLADMDRQNRAKAASVVAKDVKSGSESRTLTPAMSVSVKPNAKKGAGFVRMVLALSANQGLRPAAADFAAEKWPDMPEIGLALKAAVVTGTTTSSTWAGPLVYAENLASEFAETLYPDTIIGRIPGLRRVPFNVRIPRQTSGATVNWVGQSAPKPVSELAFDTITMTFAKIAGIVVVSEELARFSSPSAEQVVETDLRNTITKFMDQQFLDPDKAAVTNVSPAGITAGVTPIAPSGTTAAALRADIGRLYAAFLAANLGLGNSVWIMSNTLAAYIGLLATSLGVSEFPTISANGGSLFGIPVITSENMSTGQMVLLKADEILLADDGGITIDVSREASIQMDSAPTDPPVAATVYRSLWQMNEVGIRVERYINWAKRRSGVVQFIANAGYGGAPGGSGT